MATQIPGDLNLYIPTSTFTSGEPAFLVTATTSGGAHTLYTAQAGTSDVSRVWLWAQNVDSASTYTLSLELGATTLGPVSVLRQAAPLLVLDGVPLANAKTLKAYASAASKIVVLMMVTRSIDIGVT